MEFGVFIGAHNLGHARSEAQLFDDITEQAVLGRPRSATTSSGWSSTTSTTTTCCPTRCSWRCASSSARERIRVGVAVVILRDHHPLQLAGRIAQLDVLYPGRFELAVGRGSSGYEAVRFQREMDVDTSRAHFLEHLEVMVHGWRNDADSGARRRASGASRRRPCCRGR